MGPFFKMSTYSLYRTRWDFFSISGHPWAKQWNRSVDKHHQIIHEPGKETWAFFFERCISMASGLLLKSSFLPFTRVFPNQNKHHYYYDASCTRRDHFSHTFKNKACKQRNARKWVLPPPSPQISEKCTAKIASKNNRSMENWKREKRLAAAATALDSIGFKSSSSSGGRTALWDHC